VPARLAGWAFAAVVGIGAQLLVWPSRCVATRQACLALADLVEVTFAQDQQPPPVR
jgi:hypothetical protein